MYVWHDDFNHCFMNVTYSYQNNYTVDEENSRHGGAAGFIDMI